MGILINLTHFFQKCRNNLGTKGLKPQMRNSIPSQIPSIAWNWGMQQWLRRAKRIRNLRLSLSNLQHAASIIVHLLQVQPFNNFLDWIAACTVAIFVTFIRNCITIYIIQFLIKVTSSYSTCLIISSYSTCSYVLQHFTLTLSYNNYYVLFHIHN